MLPLLFTFFAHKNSRSYGTRRRDKKNFSPLWNNHAQKNRTYAYSKPSCWFYNSVFYPIHSTLLKKLVINSLFRESILFFVVFGVYNKAPLPKTPECLSNCINIIIVFSRWKSGTLFNDFFSPTSFRCPY